MPYRQCVPRLDIVLTFNRGEQARATQPGRTTSLERKVIISLVPCFHNILCCGTENASDHDRFNAATAFCKLPCRKVQVHVLLQACCTARGM